MFHESRFIHGVTHYKSMACVPRNTLHGRFQHVMSAVGRGVVISHSAGTCFLHRSLILSECCLLIVFLVIRPEVKLDGKSGAKSLNYTAVSTDMKFPVASLLWVPPMTVITITIYFIHRSWKLT